MILNDTKDAVVIVNMQVILASKDKDSQRANQVGQVVLQGSQGIDGNSWSSIPEQVKESQIKTILLNCVNSMPKEVISKLTELTQDAVDGNTPRMVVPQINPESIQKIKSSIIRK